MNRLVRATIATVAFCTVAATSVPAMAAPPVTPPVPKDLVMVAAGPLTTHSSRPALDTVNRASLANGPVRQLIVKTTNGRLATTAITRAASTYSGGVGATVVRRMATGMTVLRFSKPISATLARRVSAQLTARTDVTWAQPDHHFVALGSSPVPLTDPYFSDQWDLWDSSYASPNGGYSVRAPNAWQHELGRRNIVVAVLDTGLTPHPELANAIIPTGQDSQGFTIPYGYDFITDPFTANDNDPSYAVPTNPPVDPSVDSRDSNPLDPGDWVTQPDVTNYGSATDYGCAQVESSSWHGTHVAGTIAAAQNAEGISGIAPGITIEPVRVLGKCGGSESDVVDAIEWASGHSILLDSTHTNQVPNNAHPASVITMSLGGPGVCSPALQQAIDDARAAGTTVVVAAGNAATDVTAVDANTGSVPADCNGVISVSATGQAGELAQYSNYGTHAGAITIAAPGGDDFGPTGTGNILSTWWNSPDSLANGSADYAFMAGTSMAAPHVAAVAALIQSHLNTPLTPDQLAQRLRQTATPFPASSQCTVVKCGAGILNAGSAIPTVPSAPDYVSATPLANDQLRLVWSAPASGGSPVLNYVVEVSTDAGQSWNPASASDPVAQGTDWVATISGLSDATSYRFRVAAVNQLNQGNPAAYQFSTMTSDVTTAMNPPTPAQPAQPTTAGGVEKFTVTWAAATGVPPATGYRVIFHRRGTAPTWTTVPATIASSARTFTYTPWPHAALTAGIYDVRVAALHGTVVGPASLSRAVSVTGLIQSGTISNTIIRPFKDGFQDSLVLRATSNVPRTGIVRIRNTSGAIVTSWPLPAKSTWATTWSGLNSAGKAIPYGTYAVEFWRPVRGSALALISRTQIRVLSSQAAIPTVRLGTDVVYPFKDKYRDTVRVTANAVVPSTFALDILDHGRVIYHRTYSSRMTLTVPWNGTNDRGKIVAAGAYTLRITAHGTQGRPAVKQRRIDVSAQKAIPKSFSVTFTAASALKAYTSGVTVVSNPTGIVFDGGDDPATVDWLEFNLATFSRALPTSILPPTSVKVSSCTSRQDNHATNNAFMGYFGGPVDNPDISADWSYRVGDPAGCYPAKAFAPSFSIVNGRLQFWVGNGSLPGNTWTANTFTVSGITYSLGT